MLRSYRCIIVAAFGWLSLGSQAPSAQRVTSPAPPPKEQAKQPAQASQPKPAPIAVTIVESPEQAVAGDRGKAESQEHDSRDLDAQIRAANAAENQVFPSWLGAMFSFIGTGLIVWTLLETRKSSKAAIDAADYARQTLHSDRAWLIAEDVNFGPYNGFNHDNVEVKNGIHFSIKWRNVGRTPSIETSLCVDHCEVVAQGPLPAFDICPSSKTMATIGMDKTATTMMIFLDDETTARFRAQKSYIALYSQARYRDIFTQETRVSEICFAIAHSGGTRTDREGVQCDNLIISPQGPQNRTT